MGYEPATTEARLTLSTRPIVYDLFSRMLYIEQRRILPENAYRLTDVQMLGERYLRPLVLVLLSNEKTILVLNSQAGPQYLLLRRDRSAPVLRLRERMDAA